MQIVVDIDEKRYGSIKKHGGIPTVSDGVDAANAILNGTPLPKGHGRLIDANELPIDIEWHDVEIAPTIIEVDTEGEEEE